MSLALLAALSLSGPAHAGSLWKQDIERLVGPDYVVGEIQSDLAVYPLYVQNPSDADAKPDLKAYAFETNDLTAVRGYSGKPINILVVMDLNGTFLSAQLIEQKEPLFVRDDDAAKLHAYTRQHNGLSLRHTIEVGRANDTPSRTEQAAHLRGVHTGTITAKAITRTILSAAANVALARLKLAGVTPDNGKTSAPAALPPASLQTTAPAEAPKAAAAPVVADKPAATPAATTAEPAASAAAGKAAAAAPGATSALPAAPGPQAAATAAPPPTTTTTTAPGAAADVGPATTPAPADTTPASRPEPAAVAPVLTALALQASDEPEWLAQWQSRRAEIALLIAGLALLTIALIAQKRFSANARRLRWMRTLFLLYTVGFIGWFAQGQLTIVNVTAAIESLSGGGDLAFLMNDPMTVILWLFVGATLLVWGRGTFCGWLCPFGALQELVSLVANAVGMRQRRLRAALDAKLKWLKYGVLAVILGSLFVAPDFASWAVEIEPFKTAISLYFVRSWPFVLWAAGCLALGVFVYRGYCRYICPLGAALATMGFLRRWPWIARRTSCGTPCQTCRHRCEYQAIDQTGKVNYRECFQCLDCVSIWQDDKHCLPLILEKKKGSKVIPVREVARI